MHWLLKRIIALIGVSCIMSTLIFIPMGVPWWQMTLVFMAFTGAVTACVALIMWSGL